MKKRIFALFLIVLLLFSTGCHKATLKDYKLFRSTPLGFSIEYPAFWSYTSDNAEDIAVFVTPTEGYSDSYNDSVSVQRIVLDIEGDDAYNTYLKGYVADLSRRNIRMVSETEGTLGGKTSYQIVYESATEKEGVEAAGELRVMQIFVQHKKHVYILTYMGEFKSYNDFFPYVENMISTFKFI